MTKHTPTPYRVIIDDTGGQFTGWPSINAAEELDTTIVHRAGFHQGHWGELSQRECKANAAFIVLAVNSYEQLVAALEELNGIATHNGTHHFWKGLGEAAHLDRVVKQARAALAAAKGDE